MIAAITAVQHPLDANLTKLVKEWLEHTSGDLFRSLLLNRAQEHIAKAVAQAMKGGEGSKALAEGEFEKARGYQTALKIMDEFRKSESLYTVTLV